MISFFYPLIVGFPGIRCSLPVKIPGETPRNSALDREISRVAPRKFDVRAGDFLGKFPGYPPAASRFPGSPHPVNLGNLPVKFAPRAGNIACFGIFPYSGA